MHTERLLKIKLTLGYILLIGIFSVSILYIVKELKELNISKDEIAIENTKVILLGNLINDLYAAENTGRLAMVSQKIEDSNQYHRQLDSLIGSIEYLKINNIKDEQLKNKLDTITELIKLKRLNFDNVRDVQQKFRNSNTFVEAQAKIREIQDSQNIVAIDTVVEKANFTERLFTNRTRKQKERLQQENERIIEIQKHYFDSLNKATDQILSKAQQTESQLLKNYYREEAKFIQRNKELSQELQTLLLDVEKIILKNNEITYEASKASIDNVSNNIAKVGIALAIIALIFGFVILYDLNKSARYKKKLEEMNASMENMVRQKSFILASIAHDMVSPLNSLMGFSSLLKNTIKTQKQSEYINNIEASSLYIKSMVDDLSLFSNLEYNNIKIKKERFNFNTLVNNITNNLKVNAERKGIQLIADVDSKLDQNFYSDSYRIQQILTNIISNAVKFTHQGSVTVKAIYSDNEVSLKIIDTGIGINTKDKKEVFKEFVQVHDTGDTIYGGSGLGLNISKRLVDLLSGSIDLESELGKGTTFFIKIPLQVFDDEKAQNTEPFEYDNDKKLQNKRILIIDDDPLQLRLIEEILGNKVKLLTCLENGSLAKELLQKETYHLIVTDMQMPHYSGLEVIKDIRSIKEYAHTPIIALTGKIDYDEAEYQNLGFNLYMKKPLDINTLYNTIYKLLRIKMKETKVTKYTATELMTHSHFDLTELNELLDNDQEALKQILTSFIENAREDLEKIRFAIQEDNVEHIKNIAHKMLPMFRQLKMEPTVHRLQILERNADELSIDKLKSLVKETLIETNKVLDELEKIYN